MDRKKSPGWRKKDEKKIQMTRADKNAWSAERRKWGYARQVRL